MAFIERDFKANDYQAYKKLLGAGDNVREPVPSHWIVDEEKGIQLFELGGRGEMPASTGAPPDAYVMVVDYLAYRFGLRYGVTDGKSGGAVYKFSVETIGCSADNKLTRQELILLLRDALFASEVARLRRILSKSFVEDVIIVG